MQPNQKKVVNLTTAVLKMHNWFTEVNQEEVPPEKICGHTPITATLAFIYTNAEKDAPVTNGKLEHKFFITEEQKQVLKSFKSFDPINKLKSKNLICIDEYFNILSISPTGKYRTNNRFWHLTKEEDAFEHLLHM